MSDQRERGRDTRRRRGRILSALEVEELIARGVIDPETLRLATEYHARMADTSRAKGERAADG